jgi:hypothetical protein
MIGPKNSLVAFVTCLLASFVILNVRADEAAAVTVVQTPVEPEKKFSLRPGFPGEISAGLDSFVCKFEYTVEGGSNEEWNIVVAKTGDLYTCNIGRPTSYLYFKKFLISLTKAEVVSVDTTSNGQPIEAWTSNKKNNRLRNKKDWEGNMSGISIVAKKAEEGEL